MVREKKQQQQRKQQTFDDDDDDDDDDERKMKIWKIEIRSIFENLYHSFDRIHLISHINTLYTTMMWIMMRKD